MNKKGSALLLVVGIISVLVVLCGGYSLRIIHESSIARKNVYSTQAFWISEAGIQAAAWDYANNQCQAMTNASTGVACTNCLSCGSGTRLYTGTIGNGTYSVSINPSTKTYISTGSVWRGSDENRQLLAQRKIKMIFGQSYIFGYGAFAQGALDINNNSHIDSYNSNNGPYDSQVAAANGNVGTNGSAVNIIDIGNNSIIKGSVSTGPGGTIDYKVNKVTITGGITHANDVYVDPVSVPSDLQAAVYQETPDVNNGVINLSEGLYRFDNIPIANNGTVNISGDVKIYLTNTTTALTTGNNIVAFNIAEGGAVTIYADGAIDFGNKVAINHNSANPNPANFVIFSRYAGINGVIIDNNNVFYGAVYAPLTDVEVSNNAQFFGAVVGETVAISNNGIFHYDEALVNLAAPWQPAELRDWQEQFD